MRPETIALHSGYESDPATKAVAVPIYQTVAYSFDSAAHGAALFDLEVEGFRYTRIGNPTCAVLEQRLAELEGGIDALVTSSGQAAMYYTVLNLHRARPQPRLGAAALRHHAHAVRPYPAAARRSRCASARPTSPQSSRR